MNNEGRWILVSDGTAQMMYAGKTTLSEEAIDEAIMINRPIELTECRSMRTLLMPNPNGSMGQSELLSPVSIARSGIRMKIKVAAYFWPEQDDKTAASFAAKLNMALQSEAQFRAAEAGIVTPSMSAIPGGKLRQ
jgi:hypothetical protein